MIKDDLLTSNDPFSIALFCSANRRFLDMASSHGVPRVAKEGDVEKEREQIREYRALVDSVNAKVHDC